MEKKKINVLLIGDSIRMNYQKQVIKLLGTDYCVFGSEDNGRFAKFTLADLRRMVELFGKTPDIIHWNNGLWDCAVSFKEDGLFTPLEEYRRDLSRILREVRKITPNVIFATTTPVRPENHNHDNKTIHQYNRAAIEVMSESNVVINDLNALVSENISEYICEDTVHLSEQGITVCARKVAECIRLLAESRSLNGQIG